MVPYLITRKYILVGLIKPLVDLIIIIIILDQGNKTNSSLISLRSKVGAVDQIRIYKSLWERILSLSACQGEKAKHVL